MIEGSGLLCTFEWKSDRLIFGNAPLFFTFLLCRAFTLIIFAFHWRWVHFAVTESRGIAETGHSLVTRVSKEEAFHPCKKGVSHPLLIPGKENKGMDTDNQDASPS